MRTLPLLGLLLAGPVLAATPGACKKAAREADAQLVSGDRAGAWALAERWGQECPAVVSGPAGAVVAWFHASQDEGLPLEARAVATERVAAATLIAYGPRHERTAEWLGNLAAMHQQLGAYDLALPLWERALAIRQEVLGPDHGETGATTDALASLHRATGDYATALPLQLRAARIIEAAYGPAHPHTATTTNNLGGLYDALGRYAEAEAAYRRALAIREQALGPDDPATAASLDALAGLLGALGAFPEALQHGTRGLAIRERALGRGHVVTATSLDTIAGIHQAKGDLDAALPLYERALAIREQAFGPDHPITARAISALGGVQVARGQLAVALPLYERALAIRERALGPDHRDTGEAASRLGSLHQEMGAYGEALPLLARSLEVAEASLGPDHPDTARALLGVAGLHAAIGDFDRALALDERAVDIFERALGPDHPDTALALNNLAEVHRERGDYRAALELLERALAIREQALGPDHPDTAVSLNNLAGLYGSMGAHDKALPLLQRALDAQERALGPNHPDTGVTLNNIAAMLQGSGEPDEALTYYTRALAATEAALGPDHPGTAISLGNLAGLALTMGDLDAAEPLYARALAIREAKLGPAHPETAAGLVDLAGLLHERGAHADALPLYERALATQEAALGPDHPDTARTLTGLAALRRATGDAAAAVDLERRAVEAQEAHLARHLVIGSPGDQRAFLDSVGGTPPSLVSLSLRDLPRDRAAADLALTTVLRRKARALEAEADVMSEARRSPGGEAAIAALRVASTERDALGRRGPGPEGAEAWRAELAARDARIDALQAELASLSARYRARSAPVTIEAVRAALPAGSALVEIVIWSPFDATQPRAARWGPGRYAAWVVRADGQVTWADLGPADAIDAQVQRLRAALVGGSAWQKAAAGVHAAVLGPVQQALEGTTRLYVAPDGELHTVPLGLLTDTAGRRLDQGRQIVVLATGRELLGHGADPADGGPPVVVAGVDYGPGGPWPALAGAAAEGAIVAEALGVAPIAGADATEAALQALSGPRLLHVASHGFFDQASPEAEVAPGSRGVSVRSHGAAPPPVGWDDRDAHTALWRSGLALAGANDAPASGYLTAAEVSAMDLRGTRLVVLSACETGLGASRAGQGVMGLRYALVVAGARAQVLSLWKVDDAATQALMAAFYRELARGRGAGEALAVAQADVAADPRWAHPRYWAAFTLSGDPDVGLAR